MHQSGTIAKQWGVVVQIEVVTTRNFLKSSSIDCKKLVLLVLNIVLVSRTVIEVTASLQSRENNGLLSRALNLENASQNF